MYEAEGSRMTLGRRSWDSNDKTATIAYTKILEHRILFHHKVGGLPGVCSLEWNPKHDKDKTKAEFLISFFRQLADISPRTKVGCDHKAFFAPYYMKFQSYHSKSRGSLWFDPSTTICLDVGCIKKHNSEWGRHGWVALCSFQFSREKIERDMVEKPGVAKKIPPNMGTYAIPSIYINAWIEWLIQNGYSPHQKASRGEDARAEGYDANWNNNANWHFAPKLMGDILGVEAFFKVGEPDLELEVEKLSASDVEDMKINALSTGSLFD